MAHSAFRSRSYQRFPATYPVIFGGAPFVGEGTIFNLSLTGCSVACDRTVLMGSYIKLKVFLPESAASVFIELGTIRWVRESIFGVEFIRLPTIARQQLDQLADNHLAALLQHSSPADSRNK